MRITRLATTFGAIAMALAAAACGGDDGGSGSGSASGIIGKASSQKKLVIGVKADQPGLGLQTGSTYSGYDIEIAKIVAKGLGVDPGSIQWKTTVSANREPFIQQGQVDLVVATYTINDERKKVVNFAGPYYIAGQDLMVKADNTTITGPEVLKAQNTRVCSVSGSTPAKTIEQYVDPANIVLFDVYSKCADALRNGQVEAVTTDNVILSGLVDSGQGAFKLVGKTFTKEPYGIGIAKGDTKFCEFIDKALQESVTDGSYAAAWSGSAGKLQGAVPPLPPADACS
jgi:glutamate transport system substrate-binding protein